MTTEHYEVFRLAYRCTLCRELRVWGDSETFLTDRAYQPLLGCDTCEQNTRHEYVGLLLFNMSIAASMVKGEFRHHLVLFEPGRELDPDAGDVPATVEAQ